jgi:hypothetical protein
MKKVVTTIILSISIATIPWIYNVLLNILPIEIGKPHVNFLIFNAVSGIGIGFVFFKKKTNLLILPILLLLFISSSILWSIHQFNTNKIALQTSTIEYPLRLEECEKESNFENLWDHMINGCHYTIKEFTGNIIDRVLVLTIFILLSRILFRFIQLKKSKQNDPEIIDQEEIDGIMKSEIDLSSNSDEFEIISNILEEKLKIKFTKKLNGLDQSYWDFKYKGNRLTLHREHYLGVSIFIKDKEKSIDSDILIQLEIEIRKYFDVKPATNPK